MVATPLENVVKYLNGALERHPHMPSEVRNRVLNSKSKMAAKRALKKWLESKEKFSVNDAIRASKERGRTWGEIIDGRNNGRCNKG